MTPRYKEILELRDISKLTYKELGAKFNISATCARFFYLRAKEEETFINSNGLNALYSLCESDAKTVRVLYSAGIKTINDLVNYVGNPSYISSARFNILREKAIRERSES